MTERELIKKLHNLNNLNPDANWLKSEREILVSQIKNSSGEFKQSLGSQWFMWSKNFILSTPQPAIVGAFIFVFMFVSVIYLHKLPVKPNNSLYIAKIISEQANLSTTFSAIGKDRLAAQFASDNAKDIANVLSDPQFNNDSNKTAVEKLNTNFKNELSKVKNSLLARQAKSGDDGEVFNADSSKDNQGVSVYDPNKDNKLTTASSTESKNGQTSTTTASTTIDNKSVNTTTDTTAQILDDAEKLFNSKDYSGAVDKLNQVDDLLK